MFLSHPFLVLVLFNYNDLYYLWHQWDMLTLKQYKGKRMLIMLWASPYSIISQIY